MQIRALIVASLGLIWMAGPAYADPVPLGGQACPDESRFISTGDVTGDTGGSDACFGAFDGNDPGPSGDGIETGGMIFDFIAKADTTAGLPTLDPAGFDIGLSVMFGDDCDETMGADDNGCWSFSALPTGFTDFMIVIKAASSPGWAAYLFDTHNDATSGTWQVAWGSNRGSPSACAGSANPVDVNCKDISHLAIYAKRGDDMRVAEPGTLGLLGLGLVGLGIARRRRHKL